MLTVVDNNNYEREEGREGETEGEMEGGRERDRERKERKEGGVERGRKEGRTETGSERGKKRGEKGGRYKEEGKIELQVHGRILVQSYDCHANVSHNKENSRIGSLSFPYFLLLSFSVLL